MAIMSQDITIGQKFVCPTEESANNLAKRDYTFRPNFLTRSPHVDVSMYLGPRGVFVSRVNMHDYKGHVPTSPILLGRAQKELYLSEIARLSSPVQQFPIVCTAFVFGALAVGLMTVAPVLGAGLACLYYPAINLNLIIATACMLTLIAGVGFAAKELLDIALAYSRLNELYFLSRDACAVLDNQHDAALHQKCSGIVRRSYNGFDFALREAATEYEQVMQFHGREGCCRAEAA